MTLFGRRPPGPGAFGSQPSASLEVIRRIKVTIDRYWVTTRSQVAPPTAPPADSTPPAEADERKP